MHSKNRYCISLFAIVALCAYASNADVWKDDATGILWEYQISDGCAIIRSDRSWSSAIPRQTSGEVIIPSTLGDCPVTSVGEHAFLDCQYLTSIVLPESVTNVGAYAFYDCSGLTTLTIPAGVRCISTSAFYGCRIEAFLVSENNAYYAARNGLLLTKNGKTLVRGVNGDVVIPNGVTTIGESAFMRCGLTSVTIPEGVLSIEDNSFNSCRITNVTIPSSVTNISNKAFSDCASLNEIIVGNGNSNYMTENGLLLTKDGKVLVRGISGDVSIPNGVEIIGDDAFSGCQNLTNVVISPSITNIGDYAFSECYNLTNAVIPTHTVNIGDYAFSCCGLTTVDIPNSVVSLGECAFAGCDGLTTVAISSRLTSIEAYTFQECGALTNVTIHEGVTSIGEGAFSSCSSLATVTIPSTVTNIGVQAFECTGLRDLILSEGVSVIGGWAFSGCGSLEAVTIPSTVKDIGDYAFYACGAKIDGLISANITNIGEYAFAECGGITKVTIPPSVENIGPGAFANCTGIVSVVIQDGVTKIGDCVFESCSGLQSVVIPSSVIEMGGAFNSCYPREIVAPGWALCELDRSEVTNVTITAGTSVIDDSAFSDCRSLISVMLSEGVTRIGENAFCCCEKLQRISIPSTVNQIAGGAFAECPSLGDGVVIVDGCVLSVNGTCPATVILPEGTRLIAEGAFGECESLKSVTIPASVSNIPTYAFGDCSSLAFVFMPSSVTNIGMYAFSECTSLQSMSIPYGVTRIGYGAFNGCSALFALSIPTSVTDIEATAFRNCTSLSDVVIPNGVENIGGKAFADCQRLDQICFVGNAPTVGDGAFDNTSRWLKIYINSVVQEWPTTGVWQNLTVHSGLPQGTYLEKVGDYEWMFTIPCSTDEAHIATFTSRSVCFEGLPLHYNRHCAVVPDPIGALEIPKVLGGYPVTRIGNDAFALCTNLTSVTIPQSVSAIEDGAFLGCSGLGDGIVVADGYALCINGRCPENVVFPEGTRLIGDGIFRYCSNMKTLVIPEGVTEIGWNAFAGCSGLESVSIPASVTEMEDAFDIDEEAFVGCSGLKRVTVSELNAEYKSQNGLLLTKDGATLVRGINGRVTIPEGVTCIADYAFMGCTGLTAVTIPYGVASIGWGAFSGCSGLTSIDLPSSVTDVDAYAFMGCNGFKTISVGQANSVYEVVGGLLLTKGGGTLVSAVSGNVTIPLSVTNVFECALHGCNKLTVAQTNPAYKSLNGLLLTKDGKTLVRGVNGRVAIPEGVTDIADYAFMGCTGLTLVTIPYGVTSIGWRAFDGCSQLKSIEIPATVTDIDSDAFSGCNSLEIVVSKENQEYRSENGMLLSADGETLFRGVNRRTVIPDGVTTIYYNAFAGCSEMTSLTLPSSVTDIYEDVFAGRNEALVVNVPSDCDYEVLRELLRYRISVQTGSSSVPSYEIIVGRACSIDVGFKGYTAKGLPTGLNYDSKKGLVTGTVKKEVDDATVIFTKSGETDVEILFVVRKETNPTVACEGLDGTTLALGVTGGSAGIPLDLGAESGVKSVTATKLPTGMKIASSKDKTSWCITGAPTKAGTYDVAITLTTAAGNKVTEKFSVTVAALPSGATGTFNGFVQKAGVGEDETLNAGSFQVMVSDVGKITAKVVAAAGTYSFTATGWDSVNEGVYSIEMMTKKGDVLTLRCDSTAAWNAHQVTGSFAAKGATALAVEAQKNAFGKQWFFNATGDEANGWTLSFVENAKSAALTVTLNADGKTSVAGKLGAYKITASGYTDVSGIGTGAIFADFAPVISIKSGKTTIKKVLSLRANLWFDKTNDHEQGVGSAVFVP